MQNKKLINIYVTYDLFYFLERKLFTFLAQKGEKSNFQNSKYCLSILHRITRIWGKLRKLNIISLKFVKKKIVYAIWLIFKKNFNFIFEYKKYKNVIFLFYCPNFYNSINFYRLNREKDWDIAHYVIIYFFSRKILEFQGNSL